MRNDRLAAALFVIAVVGTGTLIGLAFPPGGWFEGLVKPSFQPPDWLFAPVWSILYVLIGIVGWVLWFRSGRDDLRALWVAQMILNFAWSPMFFGAQNPALALVVILTLLGVLIAFILRAWRGHAALAMLFLPYAAWVAFASLLNSAIVALN